MIRALASSVRCHPASSSVLSSRAAVVRTAAARPTSCLLRPLSTEAVAPDGGNDSGCSPCKVGQCMDKLGGIMREYRRQNYAQTVPSRYAKEIVTAADSNKDGIITVDEIHGLLRNIGAADRMTREEIDIIVTEMGITGEVRAVPVEIVTKIVTEKAKEHPSAL